MSIHGAVPCEIWARNAAFLVQITENCFSSQACKSWLIMHVVIVCKMREWVRAQDDPYVNREFWFGSFCVSLPTTTYTLTLHLGELRYRYQLLLFIIVTSNPFIEVPISTLAYDPSDRKWYVCFSKGLKAIGGKKR